MDEYVTANMKKRWSQDVPITDHLAAMLSWQTKNAGAGSRAAGLVAKEGDLMKYYKTRTMTEADEFIDRVIVNAHDSLGVDTGLRDFFIHEFVDYMRTKYKLSRDVAQIMLSAYEVTGVWEGLCWTFIF